jgi:hypothetical protein
MVILGHDYHNKKMPKEYCRVEVLTVMEGHSDDFQDIPTPDSVKKLGEDINEFILWHRQDIRLNDPIPSMPFLKWTMKEGYHMQPHCHLIPL